VGRLDEYDDEERDRIAPKLPTVDDQGIITSGTCPQCRATVGYAHKMSCSYGYGKGLRFYADLKGK
jgi:hypothetical protein